jgi:PAS domain S-box-containing protein
MGVTGGQTSSLVFLQYLTTVLDNIADGILLVSIDGPDNFTLTMANRPFLVISGYPEDSVGKNLRDIVSPESYAFLTRQYRKVVRTKHAHDYIRWAEVPAGMRAFDVRMVPVFNTTGDCIQIACFIHDATEREQLREEIVRLRETVRGIRRSV